MMILVMNKSRPRLIAWALEAFFLLLIVKQVLDDPVLPRLLLAPLAVAFAWWNTESSLRRYLEYKAQAPHPLTALEYLAIVLLTVLAIWLLWSGFAAYIRNEWWRVIVDGVLGLAILWACGKSLFPEASESGDA